MTHSRPVDTAPIRGKIGELCSALIRLDQNAVQAGCSDLEGLFLNLKDAREKLSTAQGSELRAGLNRVQDLIGSALHMYAGWARIAALQGQAYTRSGTESSLPSESSVAVEA